MDRVVAAFLYLKTKTLLLFGPGRELRTSRRWGDDDEGSSSGAEVYATVSLRYRVVGLSKETIGAHWLPHSAWLSAFLTRSKSHPLDHGTALDFLLRHTRPSKTADGALQRTKTHFRAFKKKTTNEKTIGFSHVLIEAVQHGRSRALRAERGTPPLLRVECFPFVRVHCPGVSFSGWRMITLLLSFFFRVGFCSKVFLVACRRHGVCSALLGGSSSATPLTRSSVAQQAGSSSEERRA